MNDLRKTIVPKSDQLNSDDLIGRTLTITITKVLLTTEAEQPVAIHFEGDDGKPYKACKSMRRVMVNVWGPDGNAYIGRSMTLYRDPSVKFGPLEVGGIRISHMSHIERPVTMALTATRANRKPFTVKPLAVAAESAPPQHTKRRTFADWLAELESELAILNSADAVSDRAGQEDVQKALAAGKPEWVKQINAIIKNALDRVQKGDPPDSDGPADYDDRALGETAEA